jgi:hemolysin activation/secretion protein
MALVLAPATLTALVTPTVAQDRRDELEALQLEKDKQRREQLNRQAPLLGSAKALQWLEPVADESPCFRISRFAVAHNEDSASTSLPAPIEIAGTQPTPQIRFDWLARELGAFETACLGAQSLDALRRNLDARLAQAGYVTSSVSIPPQNLSAGTLQIVVQVGRVAAIMRRKTLPANTPAADQPSAVGVNALAIDGGQILNLRAIEHSLENLARLPSQAARFQIEAGERVGESVLLIDSSGTRPWQADITLDNAAPKEYGRWQWQVQAALDGPLGLSDQASLQLGQTVRDQTERGKQRSASVSYSIPFGYALFNANVSRSENRRIVQGTTVRFVERGFDRSSQLRAQWTFWRSAASRAALWGSAVGRRAQTFIDDTELVLQRRKSVRRQLGLTVSGQSGDTVWSLDAERDAGRKLAVAPEFGLEPPEPSRQSQLRLGLSAPFEGAGLKAVYSGQLQAQYVRGATSAADLASVGSRYSVRGFDGQDILQAPAALTLRQELRLPPWRFFGDALQAQPFVALDAAQVFGRSTENEGEPSTAAGSSLAGMAVGARWRHEQFFGDVTVGWPLHKPSGASTPGQTVVYATLGFQL